MDVVSRVNRRRRSLFRLRDRGCVNPPAIQHGFHRGKAQRPVADPDRADMGVACLSVRILVVPERGGRHGEVAAAAGEFLKAPAPLRRPGREADLGDDFVRGERRRQRGDEEIHRRDHTRAGSSHHRDFGLACHRDAGQLGGRIGMGDAAADGATIADLIVRDMLDGRDQQRLCAAQASIVENVAPAHQRTECDAARRNRDRTKLRQLAQVDQEGRRSKAKGKHGYEALTARDGLGVLTRGEQSSCFGDGCRTRIFERRQLHVLTSALSVRRAQRRRRRSARSHCSGQAFFRPET
jgi:hypothetical protein